ncbi:hypothetical protein CVD28_11095 [Bacillus sp. M6-12]|uniref:hypothetical protein n=1 Tax=Bacillus sp. M6-12 TaxID=2054166 RepID=UPI000C79276F|nr:hypothetical protein [Bacillus sp. M6-12]PLS17538.1 hypothetical protein CVD28_11095 [Bacillus sp. M6-12]
MNLTCIKNLVVSALKVRQALGETALEDFDQFMVKRLRQLRLPKIQLPHSSIKRTAEQLLLFDDKNI